MTGPDPVRALREAAARPPGPLRALMDEAADHLDLVLRDKPPGTVAAVAVPIAVFAGLRPAPPPPGLLTAAAATYLALRALDDQMDATEPAFWAARRPSEIVLGALSLLQLAGHVVADGARPPAAERMRALYQSMITEVIEGQLLSEAPLSETTTAKAVTAAISARSGAMLAGFAALAAVAASAEEKVIDAARAFGHELGVARQHLNDLTELVGEETGDLRNRTATLATALALQPLSPAGRRRLIDTLHTAADDPTTRRRLVTENLATAISEVAVVIELHLHQARRAATVLIGPARRADALEELVELTATPLRRNHVRQPGSSSVL